MANPTAPIQATAAGITTLKPPALPDNKKPPTRYVSGAFFWVASICATIGAKRLCVLSGLMIPFDTRLDDLTQLIAIIHLNGG